MQITFIVLGLLIGVFIYIQWSARRAIKNTPLAADHEKIMNLTVQNFNHQTKGKIVLVDFWAEWCAPCRLMAPVLNDVAAQLDGNKGVGKVNIELHQSLARKYNVRSIPTLVLFKDGKEIDRFVGVKSKDFLINKLNQLN